MSAREAKGSLRALARDIWQLLDAAQKRECLSVLVISIIAACLTLVGVAGIAPFFAVLADPTVVDRSAALAWMRQALAIETADSLLVWLGIGFVAMLSLANLATLLTVFSIERFAQGVGARMHSMLFEEYLQRDLAFHANSNGTALATRVVHDVNRTVGGVIHSGLTLCASAASMALISGAVVIVDPLVALAATALLVLSYALIYAFVRHRLARNGAITSSHWKSRAQLIAESFAAIKDVILHRGQPGRAAQMTRHSTAIAAALASTPAIAASPKYLLECIMVAGLVAAALWIRGTAAADQWLPHLVFLAFAAYRLLPAGQQVFAALARIRAERAGFDGIVDDLQCARRRTTKQPSATAAEWFGRPRQAIRLIDVSYRHSAQRAGGVSGVSLELAAGTVVGFVGPNGAGKTTLAELVLGLRTPDTGRIEVDGDALGAGNRDAWLDTVAYVPQQIALLDATIAQNIAFDVAPAHLDLERVLEAARAAQLGPLLEAMPDGVATIIGENGARLSGGQRQRIGLARALYRRASLLVVDEGTSALDAMTEADIMALLGALRGRCTVILIAHHTSSLSGCDSLVELDGGQLVGRKTLSDLQALHIARR